MNSIKYRLKSSCVTAFHGTFIAPKIWFMGSVGFVLFMKGHILNVGSIVHVFGKCHWSLMVDKASNSCYQIVTI